MSDESTKTGESGLEAALRRIVREELEACLSRLKSRDRFLNAEEAAALLSCSEDYLYRNAKKLPFVRRVSRMLRFSERGLLAYLEAKKTAKQ